MGEQGDKPAFGEEEPAEILESEDEGKGDGEETTNLGEIEKDLGRRVDSRKPGGRSGLANEAALFQKYIREAASKLRLTPEEERAIAVAYEQTKDPELAKKLVEANLLLVVKIAKEFKGMERKIMDLIQEGNLGLMHAVKKFEPQRGVKLSSYASWWIRARILNFIIKNRRMLKADQSKRGKAAYFSVQRERRKREKLGLDASDQAIADVLGFTAEEVRAVSQGDVSLSQPIYQGDDGKEVSLEEALPSVAPTALDTLGQAEEQKIVREIVAEVMPSLNAHEQYIMTERLLAEKPLTLEEVGRARGVTRERIRQLEVQAKEKLRQPLSQRLGGRRKTDGDKDKG